jgi:hypothetical protein
MNNYLDLLAINNTNIKIELIIDCIVDNGAPDLKVLINNQELYNKPINQEITFNYKLALLDNLSVQLRMSNKTYSADKETAVIIKSLKIDNYQMVGYYDSMVNYINDQNIDYRGFYLGFNGVWQFKIDQPFYRWWHRQSGQGWLLEPAPIPI